jgi:hypothetical protein
LGSGEGVVVILGAKGRRSFARSENPLVTSYRHYASTVLSGFTRIQFPLFFRPALRRTHRMQASLAQAILFNSTIACQR